MHVLNHERETALTDVTRARLAHRAGRRVGPERFVVGAAIVVAGEAKDAGEGKDQQRWREYHPARPPPWHRTEPAMRGVSEQLGRIERRKVWPKSVITPLERSPGGV